jgi:hypothetical protein
MSEIQVNTINEYTSANGVTIDGVKLKDNAVETNTISEGTSGSGVTIDSVLLKDGVAHSGLVKLFSHTISNDADVDADVLDENTYLGYKIMTKDIITASDGAEFRAGLRNNGSDVLTTNTYLRAAPYMETSGNTVYGSNASNTGHFEVSFTQGSDTGEMSQSIVDFMAHGSQKFWSSVTTYETTGGVQNVAHIFSILRNSDTVDGIRFYASTGNLESGSIEIWGYKK